MEARVIRPEEAASVTLKTTVFRYGFRAEEVDGRISMLEVTIPPRTLIKPLVHTRELVKPRDIPHAMWNLSESSPARVLEVVLPGGMERYFEEIEPVLREHGPEWTQRYNALAEQYGLDILDDWSNELQAKYGITL